MQIICIAVGGAGGGVGIPLAAGGYQGWHTVTLNRKCILWAQRTQTVTIVLI